MELLIEIAKAMFEKGKTVKEVRAHLRGSMLNEDFPTCSVVEEVMNIALKAIDYERII